MKPEILQRREVIPAELKPIWEHCKQNTTVSTSTKRLIAKCEESGI